MAVDLTVASIPIYFGTMAAEQKWLAKRAETEGPSSHDYTKPDTLASLAMGVGSLAVPLVTNEIAKRIVPGKTKLGKVLLGSAIAGAAITTIADRLARDDVPDDDPAAPPSIELSRRRRVARMAKKVAQIGGVATVATGTLAITTTYADRTNPATMWEKGQKHDLGQGALGWAVAIAGWDFIYYWNHRIMHEVRGLWALHVVHHSSERYNLSTALRQPVADLMYVGVPYGLLCRVGVRPYLVAQARALNLLYQYWIHTDAIDRLGDKIEATFNTPSHHRAHHGRNPQYIDRNHGSILIIWDRMFGTFEREDEPVVYGLTTNVDSFNPGVIATHEYRDIARDVAGSTTWRDRLSFVLRGPGWAYERHRQRGEAADLVAA